MSATTVAGMLEIVSPAFADRSQVAAAVEMGLVTDRDDFDALEGEWTALFDRAGNSSQLFQSHAWLWHWTRHFLNGSKVGMAIVTVRRNGRLVLVWPLARCRRNGVTRLTWMGEPVSQYGDVLVEPGAEALPLMRQAWAFIREHVPADIINLRKTRVDAQVAPLLAEIGAQVACRDSAPFARLSNEAGFERYAEQRWSAKTRKNRRRQMRRLEEVGQVAIERHSGHILAADRARQAIEQKRAWLDRRGLLSPALADPAYESFFATVAADSGRHATGCRVSVLTAGGRPAAYEIAIRCKERVAVHIIAYDPEYERGGAGAALMEASIRQAFEDGATCFDLLGPGGGYKDEWADGAVEIADWSVALSLKGRVYERGYLKLVRPRLKAMASCLPGGLRKLAAGALRPQPSAGPST